MRKSGLILSTAVAALLTTPACTRQSRTVGGAIQNPPHAKLHPPKTATVLAMERQVRNAIDAGEGDAFLRYLRGKVASEPDNTAARIELAAQYRKLGALELAVDHLRIAAERQPGSLSAVRGLAEALRDSDRPAESIAVLAAYCDAYPDAPAEVLAELAIALDESGALGEGERYHRRAIAAAPNNDQYRNNLGYNFFQQGNYEHAVHEFQAALALNPLSEAARNNLGFALAKQNRGQEALLHWESLAGPAAAHNNMAALLIAEGDVKGARQEIETSLSFDRHNASALRNLQLVAEMDGKPASFALQEPGSRGKSGWAKLQRTLGKLFRAASPNDRSNAPKIARR